MTRHALCVLTTVATLLGGCATVPPEVVELSYVTGRDLREMQSSYEQVVTELFAQHRQRRRDYLDNVWFPRFLENWREDGELVAIARGDRIWSEEEGRLVDTPPDADPSESLQTLRDWVDYALYAYADKEEELMAPLDQDERELKTAVRESFGRMIQANATVTAHLNSLREVQSLQDDLLEAMDLRQTRDDINDMIIQASDRADNALEELEGFRNERLDD